jgi:hypothetical protein
MDQPHDAEMSWTLGPGGDGLQVRVYFLNDQGRMDSKVFPAGRAARDELGSRILAVMSEPPA